MVVAWGGGVLPKERRTFPQPVDAPPQSQVRELDPNCIIMFSDAFDVLFADNLVNIRDKFLASRKKLLFAGECGCWPQVTTDNTRVCKPGL